MQFVNPSIDYGNYVSEMGRNGLADFTQMQALRQKKRDDDEARAEAVAEKQAALRYYQQNQPQNVLTDMPRTVQQNPDFMSQNRFQNVMDTSMNPPLPGGLPREADPAIAQQMYGQLPQNMQQPQVLGPQQQRMQLQYPQLAQPSMGNYLPEQVGAYGNLRGQQTAQAFLQAQKDAAEQKEYTMKTGYYNQILPQVIKAGNQQMKDSIADQFLASNSQQAKDYGAFLKEMKISAPNEVSFPINPENAELAISTMFKQFPEAAQKQFGGASSQEVAQIFADSTGTATYSTDEYGVGKFDFKQLKPNTNKTFTKAVKAPDGKIHEYLFDKDSGEMIKDLGEAKETGLNSRWAGMMPTDEERKIAADAMAAGLISPDQARTPNQIKQAAVTFRNHPKLDMISSSGKAKARAELEKRGALLDTFEENAKQKGALVKKRFQTLFDRGRDVSPLLNSLYNNWNAKVAGDKDTQVAVADLKEYLMEYVKVATGSTTNQAATDSARDLILTLLPASATPETFMALLDDQGLMMKATTDSYERVKAKLKGAATHQEPKTSYKDSKEKTTQNELKTAMIEQLKQSKYPNKLDFTFNGKNYVATKTKDGGYSVLPR